LKGSEVHTVTIEIGSCQDVGVALERKMFVEAVAAEIAHEIMAGTNYFRTLVDRSLRGQIPDREDFELAGQELARLDELLARLRGLAAHRLNKRPASLAELLEPLSNPPWHELSVSVDPGVRVACDGPRLAIALQALAETALLAAKPEGTAGIAWSFDDRTPKLSVWHTGAAKDELARPRALAGQLELCLTVARRTVRAHGWTLELGRQAERSFAAIQLRAEDVLP
jgi:signal transduction histidine kinase